MQEYLSFQVFRYPVIIFFQEIYDLKLHILIGDQLKHLTYKEVEYGIRVIVPIDA